MFLCKHVVWWSFLETIRAPVVSLKVVTNQSHCDITPGTTKYLHSTGVLAQSSGKKCVGNIRIYIIISCNIHIKYTVYQVRTNSQSLNEINTI